MNFRIAKIREYLLDIIGTLTTNNNYQINADMLSNKVDDYSLDKVPTDKETENWIIGGGLRRDVFRLRSRKEYSQDTINNLKNIGFFEQFEELIKSNNEEGILPDIPGIEEIKCINSGTLNYAGTDKAEFDIDIQIIYRDNDERNIASL